MVQSWVNIWRRNGWLTERRLRGPEGQGQEKTVPEESSLVALGRRKSLLQRWHRQQE